MVNTRFNGVRPITPVNEPTGESTVRGPDIGRGRGDQGARAEEE